MAITVVQVNLENCILWGDMVTKYGGRPNIITRDDLIKCGDNCMNKGYPELAGLAYKKAREMPLLTRAQKKWFTNELAIVLVQKTGT